MSDLRFVQSAVCRPNKCAAIPFIGQSHPKGFIDTGTTYWGERVYLSVVAVEEMARMIGWSAPAEQRRQGNQMDEMARRIVLLEEERDGLKARLGAIDVLEAGDFRARRKPGPKKEQAA